MSDLYTANFWHPSDCQSHTITAPPKTVGWWVLGTGYTTVKLAMHREPRWLTKKMMNWIFELEWKNNEKN